MELETETLHFLPFDLSQLFIFIISDFYQGIFFNI